jgi:hypothetical protein
LMVSCSSLFVAGFVGLTKACDLSTALSCAWLRQSLVRGPAARPRWRGRAERLFAPEPRPVLRRVDPRLTCLCWRCRRQPELHLGPEPARPRRPAQRLVRAAVRLGRRSRGGGRCGKPSAPPRRGSLVSARPSSCEHNQNGRRVVSDTQGRTCALRVCSERALGGIALSPGRLTPE